MAAGINDKFKKTYNAANPNVARVTGTRATAGTTLTCDNLAGWPTDTSVDFSTYKINTSNEVIAGTQIDWKGIVSGNNIGTLTRITGAADSGSVIGDVVEMNPTGNWANDLITGILVHSDQDGTLKAGAVDATAVIADSVVTTAKIADSNITSPKVAAGFVVQTVSNSFTSVATGTTVIPLDDTIPQITEGIEFMTQAITPKSSSNILVIEVVASLANDTASRNVNGAIFQDATAGALAAASLISPAANASLLFTLKHTMTAGTTSSTTFRFRAGANDTGTTTFNGRSGTRLFGAITKSTITITEYKA